MLVASGQPRPDDVYAVLCSKKMQVYSRIMIIAKLNNYPCYFFYQQTIST